MFQLLEQAKAMGIDISGLLKSRNEAGRPGRRGSRPDEHPNLPQKGGKLSDHA